MRSIKKIFICLLCIGMFIGIGFVLAVRPNCLLLPVKAQATNPEDQSSDSEASDFNESSDGEELINKPIEELSGVRTLEQEYNEHDVDWHDWAERVAEAVWGPLISSGAAACGQSYVKWQVTSDCHVRIISVRTPIPSGADVVVASIKALDGDPVLAFPRGSHKTVVDRIARVGGRVIFHRIHRPIIVYP